MVLLAPTVTSGPLLGHRKARRGTKAGKSILSRRCIGYNGYHPRE